MTHTGPDMGTEPNFMALAATFAEAQIAGDKEGANQAIDEVAAAVNEFNREAKVGRYPEGLPHTARVAMAETILKAAGGDVSGIDWVDDDTYYNSDGVAAPDFIKSATGSLVRADKPAHEPLNPVVDLTETAPGPADLTEFCEQNPLFADLVYEFIDSILENGVTPHPKLQTKIYERFDLIARTLRPEQAAALKEELDDVMASSLALRDLADTQTDDDDLSQAEVRPADQDDDPDAVWKPVTELFPPTGTIEIPEHLKQRAEAARKRIEEARKADEASTSEEAEKSKELLRFWAAGYSIAGYDKAMLLGRHPGYYEAGRPNEDNYFIDEEAGLVVLADGAGGHVGGARASEIAIETFKLRGAALNGITDPDEMLAALHEIVVEADLQLKLESETMGISKKETMITTLVVGKLFDGNKLAVVNIGDSAAKRLYMTSGGEHVYDLTLDQDVENSSTVYNMLGTGQRELPDRTREFDVRRDQYQVYEIAHGDRLVFATDGVLGDKGAEIISNDELNELAGTRMYTQAHAAKNLVQRSRKIDDTTAIVVDVTANK